MLLLGLAAISCSTAPPNVVLIISDDHGWTDYGFMGHSVIQTPHLDRLASQSLLYTRGYVPTSLCRPSLASIMTGLYPHQHGITGNDPDGAIRDPGNRDRMVNVFKKNRPLAELLVERGYVSHQSGKWWEGPCRCGGFTHCMTHGDVNRGGRHGDDGLAIGRQGMQPIYDFLEENEGTPFFLWYAPFLPHTPHNPPERLLAKYHRPGRPPSVAKYYAMVEWFDETVGDLMGYLDRRGLRDDTLVLYVSDNGWVQMSDGDKWYESRSKVSPYEAGVRTPIMVRWPGRVKPRRDDETLVGSIDFAPTVMRAAGLEPLSEMPGVDLLDGSRLNRRQALFGALFAHTAVDVNSPAANLKYRWIVRRDGWKLILPHGPNRDVALMSWDGAAMSAEWMDHGAELYNVLEDPHEAREAAEAHPDIVQQLETELDGWWPLTGDR